jgi:hypothetical protein
VFDYRSLFLFEKKSFSNVCGSGRFHDFVEIFRCSWIDLSATMEAIRIAVSADFFYYIAAPAALTNFSLGSDSIFRTGQVCILQLLLLFVSWLSQEIVSV